MVSGDRSAVVYTSTATNLDAADANSRPDVYWRSLGASRSRCSSAAAPAPAARSATHTPTNRRCPTTGTPSPSRRRPRTCAPPPTPTGARTSTCATSTPARPRSPARRTSPIEAIGNGDSFFPSISGQDSTGQYYVAFTSRASNLGAVDANGDYDVYRRALENGATVLVSRAAGAAAAANGGSLSGGIDDSGGHVAFRSRATDLDTADTSAASSAYARHVGAGTDRAALPRGRGRAGARQRSGVAGGLRRRQGLCVGQRRWRRPPRRRPGSRQPVPARPPRRHPHHRARRAPSRNRALRQRRRGGMADTVLAHGQRRRHAGRVPGIARRAASRRPSCATRRRAR